MNAAQLIRSARRSSRLTQSQLADKLGTTQSAVAHLERAGSNPTLATLDRALHAAGHRLRLEVEAVKPNVDPTLVARQLRMSPAQRLAAFESAYADVRELSRAGARARGEVA